ncbi:organic cation [Stylonychia lemnae]|uniref:Organic cation n=1 Tax=Stylonychia lemnae TaxID=5949 RepID=A0A078BCD6_STYLE|nr:organic cation [Stylonychia lemnae]|eukprot:CDW91268.1 organic cation [Stylonychia lemnae]
MTSDDNRLGLNNSQHNSTIARKIRFAITDFGDENNENSLLSAPVPFLNDSQSVPRNDYGLGITDYSFSKAITLDQALKQAGGFGLFQFLSFMVFCFAFWTGGVVVYIIHFMQAPPTYQCTNAIQTENQSWFPCQPSQFCQNFDLHCIEKYQMGLMGTCMFIGYTISSLILPRKADVYGISIILFVPYQIGIYVGLFCVGTASTIRTSVGYVYGLEFIESTKQNIAGTLLKTFDVTTPIFFAILFMSVSNNWRYYYYCGLALSLTAWLGSFLLPESPSLLISQQRFQEAREVITKIARVNGVKNFRFTQLFQQEVDLLMSSKQDVSLLKQKKPQSRSIMIYLQDKLLKRNLTILCGCWLASTFSYYMILFYMKYLPGNIYSNTIFCSTADAAGYFFTGVLFQYVGGRISLMVSLGLAAISSFCIVQLSDYTYLTPFFLFGSRLGVAAACNVLTIVNIVIFPADFRSTSFGICNIFARMAAILAPLVAELEYPYPYAILICVTTVYCVVSFFLKEKQNNEEKEFQQRLLEKSKKTVTFKGIDFSKKQSEDKWSVRLMRSFSMPAFYGEAGTGSMIQNIDRVEEEESNADQDVEYYINTSLKI